MVNEDTDSNNFYLLIYFFLQDSQIMLRMFFQLKNKIKKDSDGYPMRSRSRKELNLLEILNIKLNYLNPFRAQLENWSSSFFFSSSLRFSQNWKLCQLNI